MLLDIYMSNSGKFEQKSGISQNWKYFRNRDLLLEVSRPIGVRCRKFTNKFRQST